MPDPKATIREKMMNTRNHGLYCLLGQEERKTGHKKLAEERHAGALARRRERWLVTNGDRPEAHYAA